MNRSQIQSLYPGIYTHIDKKLLDKYIPKLTHEWTKQNCKKEAFKYSSKTEWANKSKNSYQAARRRGWIEELSNHMRSKVYTEIHLLKIAKKYKSISEWLNKDPKTYHAANKRGLVKKITKHMICLKNKCRSKSVINLETKQIFKSAREASLFLGYSSGVVATAIYRGKTAGGYRWAYCDEAGNIIKEER